MREVLCVLLSLFLIVLLARVILSWIPAPTHARGFSRITALVFAVTEPVLRPLRNVIPPIRMGMVALDLSVIIVFIVIEIIMNAGLHCGPLF